MDGYSVNEAAAVLGIPEGRVWELLARGVLAGSTEVGGDMRVILRGSAVPEAVTPAPAPNGGHRTQGGTNGGSNGGELSAFRELLTEFRNLTERYGQALLALGEARGEVASLRGRVELLEARVELRLPRVESPMAAWESGPRPEPDLEAAAAPTLEPEPDLEAAAAPMPELPAPESEAAFEPMPELPEPEVVVSEAAAPAEAPSEPAAATSAESSSPSPPPAPVAGKRKRRTRRAPRSSSPKASRPAPTSRSRLAMSGFAEALARAEDPTTAEVFTGEAPLPGADEAAEALAAYNQDLATPVMEPPATEASAMEPAAAEAPAPVTMPVFFRPGYSTETPEPDWIAEEDLVVPVSRVPAAGEQTERAGAALAVADREADVDEQPAMDEEDVPDEQLAVDEAVDEEAMAEPEATIEEVAEAAEVVAAVVAPEDVEVEAPEAVEAAEGGEPVDGPTEPANHVTLGMGVTADEWAGPEADLVPEPASDVDVMPEIAAEPPASDDDALLDALDPFSEPPSVPREPAFWEPEGRSRAPFAIPNLEGWEPAEIEALRAELRRFGTAAIPPTVAVGPASVTPPPGGERPPDVGPPSAAAPPPAPRSSPSVSGVPPRRPRGPAARAVRRLRRLLG